MGDGALGVLRQARPCSESLLAECHGLAASCQLRAEAEQASLTHPPRSASSREHLCTLFLRSTCMHACMLPPLIPVITQFQFSTHECPPQTPGLPPCQVRKLEFLLAEALAQGADCVVTLGGIQSNHCRATAVAAR